MKIKTACLCVAASLHALAYAQQPPSDTDLRAAYCIGSIQQRITLLGSNVPEAYTASERDNLNHLQAYLLPRMQYVDPLGLGAARARGQTDANALADPVLMQCTTQCIPLGPPKGTVETVKQCMAACDTEHRLPRIWACNDLLWLPF